MELQNQDQGGSQWIENHQEKTPGARGEFWLNHFDRIFVEVGEGDKVLGMGIIPKLLQRILTKTGLSWPRTDPKSKS